MKFEQIFEAALAPNRSKVFDTLEKVVNSDELEYAEDDLIDVLFVLNRAFAKQKIEFLPASEGTTKFRATKNPLWLRGGISSGAYDPSGDDIVIYVSNALPRIIHDPMGKRDFIEAAASVIGHELVHREQAKRAKDVAKIRGKKSIEVFRPEEATIQQYFRDPHEIGAMANEIIYELENKGENPQSIFKALKTGNLNVLSKSHRYKDFLEYAKDNRLVMNRLHRTIAEIVSQS